MSLKQKYTWFDFLKQNPEHREKGTKRTSPEGKKAFEAAFKSFVKGFLVKQLARCEKEIVLAGKRRDEAMQKGKEYRKAEKLPRVKLAQQKVGRYDAAVFRITKQREKTKAAQKNF